MPWKKANKVVSWWTSTWEGKLKSYKIYIFFLFSCKKSQPSYMEHQQSWGHWESQEGTCICHQLIIHFKSSLSPQKFAEVFHEAFLVCSLTHRDVYWLLCRIQLQILFPWCNRYISSRRSSQGLQWPRKLTIYYFSLPTHTTLEDQTALETSQKGTILEAFSIMVIWKKLQWWTHQQVTPPLISMVSSLGLSQNSLIWSQEHLILNKFCLGCSLVDYPNPS